MTRWTAAFPALVCLLPVSLALLGCEGAAPGGQALVGVTVIDGLGSPPVADRVVVIRDGRIAEVTPAEGWEAPRGVREIHLPGRYVMPGLIDAHARVTLLPPATHGSPAPPLEGSAGERVLRTLLAFGVTTVRDPSAAAAGHGMAPRRAAASGDPVGPRIVPAEDAFKRTGARFGDFLATPDAVPIRQQIEWLERVDLAGPEIGERIAALAAGRMPVAPTLLAYRTKLHGDDPRHRENPELSLAPAAWREAWAASDAGDRWTPEGSTRARAVWPKVLELTRRLHEGGVVLTAGSSLPDPWVIPGVGLHQELRLLHEAGIETLEVLRIATSGGAVALGLGDEVGSVTPGKAADLIVLAADPTALVSNTRAISHVFLGGHFYDPAALLATQP